MEEVFYKIKRRSDGLFSAGGHYPNFSKKGKIWRTMGHLRNHLNSIAPSERDVYDDCDIVELVSTEHILCSVNCETEAIKRRRIEEQQRSLELFRKEQAKKKIEQAKKKIEEEVEEKQKLVELLKKYPKFDKVETAGKIVKRGV